MPGSEPQANSPCWVRRSSPLPWARPSHAPRRCASRWTRSPAVSLADEQDTNLTSINWFRYASPVSFFPLAQRLARWFGLASVLLAAVGLWLGLFVAPADAQQGEAYRIIFLHVPAAWMSMFIYAVMAAWCAFSLMLNAR